jgi:hypothetical protein
VQGELMMVVLRFMRAEAAKWGPILKQANIRVE